MIAEDLPHAVISDMIKLFLCARGGTLEKGGEFGVAASRSLSPAKQDLSGHLHTTAGLA
jgi:hypothetical protein